MDKITTTNCYLPIDLGKKTPINPVWWIEVEDDKYPKSEAIEKHTDMIVLTIEQLKEIIIKSYWGGLNGTINDYREGKVLEGEGAESFYNEYIATLLK